VKCTKCGREAVVKLRHHNLKLCEEHFFEYFEKRVEKAIRKYDMFTRSDRVLVAVSGGKDSMTLWYVLNRLGYRADALFVKTWSGDLAFPAIEKIEKLGKELGREVHVIDSTAYFEGLSTYEIAKLLRRTVCSICGTVRRYLMNKFAVENGYDVLATGHNLDDEATVLLGNILHWQSDYIYRSWPVLEKVHEKFVKKVKPLVLLYEDEVRLYADLRGIDYLKNACPFSLSATSTLYKRILNELEREQPGVKIRFYTGFLKEKEKLFRLEDKHVELRECERCGYPTTSRICSFCRLREGVLEKINLKAGR